jgi:hypothetical protein
MMAIQIKSLSERILKGISMYARRSTKNLFPGFTACEAEEDSNDRLVNGILRSMLLPALKRRKERRNSLVLNTDKVNLGRRHRGIRNRSWNLSPARRFMKLNSCSREGHPEQRAAMAAVDGPSLVIAGRDQARPEP